MSATVIPDLMPSRRTSWLGSPAASRSFSLCQIGLTISAMGRSGFGNATADAPASAMNSCAELDTVSTATKKAAIVIRITSPVSNLRYSLWSFNFRHDLAAPGAKRRTITPRRIIITDHHLRGLPTLHVYIFQFLYGLSTRLELK